MPSIKDLWPDRWLKAEHLQGKRPTVTLEAVTVEPLFNPRTKRNEPRLILAFYQKQLRLPLNKTQAQALADICKTDDYTLWRGNQVVLSAGRAPNGADTIVISPVADKPAPANRAPTIPAEDDDADDDPATDPVTAGDFTDH